MSRAMFYAIAGSILILLFWLGIYIFCICVRGFRRTHGSGTSKPYLYALGMIVVSLGLIYLIVVTTILILIGGPFH